VFKDGTLVRICSTSSNIDPSDRAGTLVWIGDREATEFQEAYRFCEQNVPQMAVRRDLADAIARPAYLVDRIVFARVSRRPITAAEVNELTATYPQASGLQLRGPLCEGDRHDRVWAGQRCGWHEWNQVLPGWLREPAASVPYDGDRISTSVAVVAASLAAADPLLDLIAGEGATAIWCPRPDAIRVRGVHAVWWDDSIAGPATASEWQRRLASSGANPDRCKHVWLVNGPRREACLGARQGGVSLVLGKPFRIACLADALATRDVVVSDSVRRQRPISAA
jgi:hypothetical protein